MPASFSLCRLLSWPAAAARIGASMLGPPGPPSLRPARPSMRRPAASSAPASDAKTSKPVPSRAVCLNPFGQAAEGRGRVSGSKLSRSTWRDRLNNLSSQNSETPSQRADVDAPCTPLRRGAGPALPAPASPGPPRKTLERERERDLWESGGGRRGKPRASADSGS